MDCWNWFVLTFNVFAMLAYGSINWYARCWPNIHEYSVKILYRNNQHLGCAGPKHIWIFCPKSKHKVFERLIFLTKYQTKLTVDISIPHVSSNISLFIIGTLTIPGIKRKPSEYEIRYRYMSRFPAEWVIFIMILYETQPINLYIACSVWNDSE